ncbi:CU044_5270 family protein [Nonomuraea sp. NPDC049646]|uniref:CU044_5270 family protein n=1 Tax=unclassified Nonomuraea TaxID=2593643 RepID=UPI00379DEA86
MDDLNAVRRVRRPVPAMTPQAESAARARLLTAVRTPVRTPVRTAPPRRRPARPVWRLATAAVLAVLAGLGWAATREPEATPVASVQQLSEWAADAAEDAPGPGARGDQWLYVKELNAAPGAYSGYGVDTSRRITSEVWTSVDGKKIAWYDDKGKLLVQYTHPGIGAAELAAEPVTPETVTDRLMAALRPLDASAGDPPPPMNERLFQAIYQLMGEQALPPRVRAALFRALPAIEGVQVTPDAVDAGGRHGVAFSYTGDWARHDLILSPGDYRFLGTYGVSVTDRTFTWTGGSADVPAGTPVTWTARLGTEVVDEPGRRP